MARLEGFRRRAREVLEAPRRRVRLVLGLACVASLGVLATSFLVAPRYRASAHVQAEWSSREDPRLSTLAAELAERRFRAVRQRVLALAADEGVAVSVTPGEGDAFSIECVDADPARAALVSNRLASLLIDDAEREGPDGAEGDSLALGARLADASRAVEDRAEALRRFRERGPDVSGAGLSEIDATVAKVTEELERLGREYDQAREAHRALQEQWWAAEASRKSQAGRARFSVLRPATAPQAPFRPDRLLFGLAGAALGLALGLGAAVVAELRDGSVKSPEDLRELLPQSPLLAEIPLVRVRRPRGSAPARPGSGRT